MASKKSTLKSAAFLSDQSQPHPEPSLPIETVNLPPSRSNGTVLPTTSLVSNTGIPFKERLESLREKALVNLELAMDTAETTSDYIKSAEAVLDRTGFPRRSEVQTTAEGTSLVGEAILAALRGVGEVFGASNVHELKARDQHTTIIPKHVSKTLSEDGEPETMGDDSPVNRIFKHLQGDK